MEGAQPGLQAALEPVAVARSTVMVVSNVTAQPHGDSQEIKKLLVAQVTSPVRWEASMRYLLAQGFTRFIELGPGKALSGFMKRIDGGAQMFNVADAASLAATVEALSRD
jgi:[acyl-carrier-protein] S-malonyltransferase